MFLVGVRAVGSVLVVGSLRMLLSDVLLRDPARSVKEILVMTEGKEGEG